MNRLSELDTKLIEALKPVADSTVRLFYPFFANTFPLAFHYYHAMRNRYGAAGDDLQTRITQIPWTTPIEEILKTSGKYKCVFYATEADLRDRPRVRRERVCVYQPRSVFFEQTPHLLEVAQTSKQTFGSRETFEKLIGSKRHIDVYSDIPLQAERILQTLRPGSRCVLSYATRECADTFEAPPSSDTVRLYLYGGPLTTYLRRKTLRYLEFSLPIRLTTRAIDAFSTYICTTSQNENVLKALLDYHNTLFSAACRGASDGFWAVTTAYNRVARSQQHRSSFVDAQEYTGCLAEHYDTQLPLAEPTEPPRRHQPSRLRGKPLLLFGCGNLTLGLVLPSLNPEIPLLLVQVNNRPASDWHGLWKSVSELDSVTLSNELGYQQIFTVLSVDQVLAKTEWSQDDRFITIVPTWADAHRIIAKAGWIGTSLGPGLNEAVNALAECAPAPQGMPLLLFENRVGPLGQLRKSFDIQHIICDRICSDRQAIMGGTKITGKCEPYGEIVALDTYSYLFRNDITHMHFSKSVSDFGRGPTFPLNPALSQGDAVPMDQLFARFVPSGDVLELYRRRKRWLMNSVQYVLAVLGVDSCIQQGIKHLQMPTSLAESLLEKVDRKLAAALDVFVHCQIGRMMVSPTPKNPDSPLMQLVLQQYNQLALYENLRVYVDMSRRRCKGVTDLISRIVNERKINDYFKEHISEPFDLYRSPGGWKTVASLNTPFSCSTEDIELASNILSEAESSVNEFLRKM